MNKEIERKFLIKKFPEHLPKFKTMTIYQGYLTTGDIEVRVREYIPHPYGRKQFTMTIKSSGGLIRNEVESIIPEEFYNGIKELINAKFIKKECCVYTLNSELELEVSKVDDDWMYAEIEFKSEKDANDFNMSRYPVLLKDITADSNYKMKNYWYDSRILDSHSKSNISNQYNSPHRIIV